MAVQTLHLINDDVGPKTLKSRATDIFHLQAWIYPKVGNTGGGSVALSINCTDSRGVNSPTTVVGVTETVPATGAWAQLDGYATVPTGYDTVDPVLTLTSVPVTDIVYVDDALVRETTVAYTGVTNAATAQTTAASAIDAAVQALTGGSGTGNSSGAMKTNMQAIPSSCVAPTPNPSGSGLPAHGASGTGWTAALDSSGASTILESTGNHTKAAADNFAGVWALYAVNMLAGHTQADIPRTASYGLQGMSSLTGPIVIWNSGNSYWCLEYFVLANPAAGAQTIRVDVGWGGRVYNGNVYGVIACSDTYSGVQSVTFDNAAQQITTALSLLAPSGANNITVGAFGGVNYLGSEAMSAFNKTSRANYSSASSAFLGAGVGLVVGDSVGTAGSQTFSATATHNQWAAGIVNLIGAGSVPIGSGCRVYRTSTATFLSPAATTAVLPASTFNATPDKITSDMTWTQSTNSITVANAGWYTVTLSLLMTGSYSGSYYLGLALYKAGALVQWGERIVLTSGYTYIIQSTWTVYCNAGDALQPGSYANFPSTVAAWTGEASGIATYFEVALANRSLL